MKGNLTVATKTENAFTPQPSPRTTLMRVPKAYTRVFPDQCLQRQVTSNSPRYPRTRAPTATPERGKALCTNTLRDAKARYRGIHTRSHSWPKDRCAPVHTHAHLGNIAGKERVQREGTVPSLCAMNHPVTSVCTQKKPKDRP